MSHKQNLKPVHLHKLQICVCGCPCKPLPKLTWRWWTVWQVHLSAPAHAISCRTYSSKKGCKHVQHLHSTKCVNTYSYSWILHVDLTWNGKLKHERCRLLAFPLAFLLVQKVFFLHIWETLACAYCNNVTLLGQAQRNWECLGMLTWQQGLP